MYQSRSNVIVVRRASWIGGLIKLSLWIVAAALFVEVALLVLIIWAIIIVVNALRRWRAGDVDEERRRVVNGLSK